MAERCMTLDRVKSARPISGFAFLVTFAALLIGVAVIMPRSPWLGVVWCVVAFVGAAYFGFDFFTRESASAHPADED